MSFLVPDHGTERLGENPGVNFGHVAYATLRAVAWKYRAERNEELRLMYEYALYCIASRIKARSDVVVDDVDHALACLMEDKCPCPRCRYSY